MRITITENAILRLHERAPEIPEYNYLKIAKLAYGRPREAGTEFERYYANKKEISSYFSHQHQESTSRVCVFGQYVYVFLETKTNIFLVTVFPIPQKKVISFGDFRIRFRD